MRTKLFTLAYILLSCLGLNAREITGVVMDDKSSPIEFASITAFANDSVVGGGVSDVSGIFRIDVGQECNRVRVSYVGYNDMIISPVASDLGNIILTQKSTTLKEVVVKAPLIRRDADRIILNVAANPLSANKDAQELLKTAPGVWATDDALSIYGQGGTAVYIDDRKVNMSGSQLMTYLKTIQSSSVASIEIIPKAGAEYSADSSGGVIKISLRRNRIDGINGSAGLNTTVGEYKQWVNPFANVSFHTGRWTFNLNGNLNGSPDDRHVTHEESANNEIALVRNGVSQHKDKILQGNVMFGIFYEPGDKDKLGLQFDYSSNRSRHTSQSTTHTLQGGIDSNTLGSYITNDMSHNFNVAINWSHSMDKKGSVLKFISNYNFQQYSMDEDNEMRWTSEDRDSIYTTDNSNRYNIFVSEMSIKKVFNPKWNLNIGAKYTFNNVAYKSFHNYLENFDWINNSSFDYDTSYVEHIAALYATVNGSVGRWRLKAGIRGEYFNTSSNIQSNSRFNLFPNANISYSITEKGDYTVALGYYRNIRRPSFWSLNPVVRQASDYSYTVGNTELTPSFTDAVSLDFVLAGRFTVAAGYSVTDWPIRQMFVSNPEHPERMYLTWENEGKDRSFFIHGDGFVNITKWWNLYASTTYIVASQKLNASTPFETFSYLQLFASTTFLLPKGFNLSVNCFYNSKMKIGNIVVYPILNINPTIQKKIGKHWSVSLGVENMLQRKSKIQTLSAGYERLTYTKTYAVAKLGVTYNFNSGKKFRTPRIEKNTDNSRLSKE